FLAFAPLIYPNPLRAVAMLFSIFYISLIILQVLFFFFIPVGNENTRVRRLPWVTFSIIIINVAIFYATLPAVTSQQEELIKAYSSLQEFTIKHQEMLADGDVQNKLKGAGLLGEDEIKTIQAQLDRNPELDKDYRTWFLGSEAKALHEEFDQRFTA